LFDLLLEAEECLLEGGAAVVLQGDVAGRIAILEGRRRSECPLLLATNRDGVLSGGGQGRYQETGDET